jgi:hypothetical protein
MTKLERDYLTFFKNLMEGYGRSKQKDQLQDTINAVNKTAATLESVIAKGSVTKSDATLIMENMDEINAARDYYLDQYEDVKAFRERADKVARNTGISLDDLNATRDIVKGGIRQAMVQTRGGGRRRGRNRFEETQEIGKELLGGAIGGITGPFTPLVQAAGTVGKEVGGAALDLGWRGVKGFYNMARNRGDISGLHPVSRGMMTGETPPSPAGGIYRRGDKKKSVEALYGFFNRGAYRAKWTSDLLKATKGGKKGDGGIFDSLLKSITGGFDWIKTGLAGAIGGGVAASLGGLVLDVALVAGAAKIGWEMGKALRNWIGPEKIDNFIEDTIGLLRYGIANQDKRYDSSERAVGPSSTCHIPNYLLSKEKPFVVFPDSSLLTGTVGSLNKHGEMVQNKFPAYPPLVDPVLENFVNPISNEITNIPNLPPIVGGIPTAHTPQNEQVIEQIKTQKELNNSMKSLIEKLEKINKSNDNSQVGPVIQKEPNPFDSADPWSWLNMGANGLLDSADK